MKIVEEELERIRAEIARLSIEEATLVKVLNKHHGTPETPKPRTRSPSVKPLVLQIMAQAGTDGATSNEVDHIVRERIPSVAKDTVGSVLSRLKSDGALVYVGERYYEKKFSPDTNPFDGKLRAVN